MNVRPRPDLSQGAGPHRSSPPVLLAERQGVVFVAASEGVDSLRMPRRYRDTDVEVVAIPAHDDEMSACETLPFSDAGAWPRALPRPDLLAPALSRLLSSEHVEMCVSPGRDGAKAMLVSADGQRHPFPVAPKDTLGLLAAVFHHAPRGVVTLASARPGRILLAVRPATQPQDYRLKLAGSVDSPAPSDLSRIGLSPSLSEILGEALDRPYGLLLVSGGSSSGQSTTLSLLAETLLKRGRRGGRIVIDPRPEASMANLPWLAGSITEWPFPESLKEAAPDFVVVERLEAPRHFLLAARLAGAGTLVLAGAPPAEPQALLRSVGLVIDAAPGSEVPVMVLSQALVRTVCRACLSWRSIAAARGLRLRFHRRDLEEIQRRGELTVPVGRGCAACAGTGFAGLTGVFSYADSEGPAGSLPALREDGWRKVMEGVASHEDVAALPGAQRAMRSLREIAVLAGLASPSRVGPPDHGALQPSKVGPALAAVTEGSRAIPPRSSTAGDIEAVVRLFRAAQSGQPPQAERMTEVARGIAGRAAQAELTDLLAGRTGGFHLGRHAVHTALLAARIVAAVGQGEDAPATATLGLLHDAGLLEGGLDPGDDLPPAAAEETIDAEGRRLRPRAILASLGFGGSDTEAQVIEVQRVLGALFTQSECAGADLRCQAVALASVIDLTHDVSPPASADLHEVSSLVMAQHGRRFSPLLFRALLRAIPIFPIGCLVELSSGDVARVVAQNEENHFRPRVEISVGAGSAAPRRVVDLARAPFLHIRHRVAGPSGGGPRP